MNKVFNTLQARHDNAIPDEVSPNVLLHEDITAELGEVSDLLSNLTQAIDKVHRLAQCTQYESRLHYLMYQFDTDTAQQEIEEF